MAPPPRRAKPRDRWSGRVFLDVGRAFYLGPAADTAAHAHHAIQVCVGLEGAVRLRAGPERRWRRHEGFIVHSNHPHQFDASGRSALLLYLEPESDDGRHIELEVDPRGFQSLKPAVVDSIRYAVTTGVRGDLDARSASALYDELLRRLGIPTGSPERVEARILKVMRRLHEQPGAAWRVSALARSVDLSPRYFRVLFAREIGMSCRQYILWVRLYAAVEAVVRGTPLTEAAIGAGFADAPHLTRTFRRMFGIAPSTVSRSVSFMGSAGR